MCWWDYCALQQYVAGQPRVQCPGRCVPCTPLPCKQTKAAPTTPTLTIHSDIGLLPNFLLLLHLTSFLSFLKDPVKKIYILNRKTCEATHPIDLGLKK